MLPDVGLSNAVRPCCLQNCIELLEQTFMEVSASFFFHGLSLPFRTLIAAA